jgi:hypothetical protein
MSKLEGSKKSKAQIPPDLPLPASGREKIPKGGEIFPPFDKGGLECLSQYAKCYLSLSRLAKRGQKINLNFSHLVFL